MHVVGSMSLEVVPDRVVVVVSVVVVVGEMRYDCVHRVDRNSRVYEFTNLQLYRTEARGVCDTHEDERLDRRSE